MGEKRPKLRLSRARDIGWRHWDPIGLLGDASSWEELNEFQHSEYDGYVIRAAGMLRRGEEDAAVVAYLVKIESDHIGLGLRPTTKDRARDTVEAMKADDQLWRYADD